MLSDEPSVEASEDKVLMCLRTETGLQQTMHAVYISVLSLQTEKGPFLGLVPDNCTNPRKVCYPVDGMKSEVCTNCVSEGREQDPVLQLQVKLPATLVEKE